MTKGSFTAELNSLIGPALTRRLIDTYGGGLL
jgi:hypothetical protein